MRILLSILMLACLCLPALAADIDGTWYAEVTRDTPNGQMTIKTTLTLKAEGNALTGTLEQAWGEMALPPAKIENGKLDGNKFSFVVKREFQGNEFVVKYEGTLEGNVLKGTSAREGSDRSMPFELKRK